MRPKVSIAVHVRFVVLVMRGGITARNTTVKRLGLVQSAFHIQPLALVPISGCTSSLLSPYTERRSGLPLGLLASDTLLL
jgi:hypothetical protein